MDLFFESLPFEEKQRIHFHRFMARIHDELRNREAERDPLADIAREWAEHCRVLCFDEFYVSDIADAMLLAGILETLFEYGVTLVATSNVAPDDLYSGGLQRARFLPAIELIKQHTVVHHVADGEDHRLRLLERSSIYHYPLDDLAERAMHDNFQRMCGESEPIAILKVNQRILTARARRDDTIWFDFGELCRKPRSTLDYIQIAKAFTTVLLSNVAVMNDHTSDVARRFINLVDEFYDRNVKLLISAETPIEELYQGTRLSFEFERTRSRLIEMQSKEYLARPHLP
jgi:cell division protein ZapE